MKEVQGLATKIIHPENEASYPDSIRNSGARRAFYDALESNEALALKIDYVVREAMRPNFRGNLQKENEIRKAIYYALNSLDKAEEIFNIVKSQQEYE